MHSLQHTSLRDSQKHASAASSSGKFSFGLFDAIGEKLS